MENLEGRLGKKGMMTLDGQIPLRKGDWAERGGKSGEKSGNEGENGLALKTEALEVRARNVFR